MEIARGVGMESNWMSWAFSDGVNFQHGAVAENGVIDPRAGGKCVGQRCFVQKPAGKADTSPRLPDEAPPAACG